MSTLHDSANPPALEPPLVVVADDDDDMRMLVAARLRDEGYDVMEAEDGAALDFLVRAVQHASWREDREAVVLSDIRMPGLSGIEVLASLRREDWRLPVILWTGFDDADVVRAASRLGATALLHKPFSVNDLVARVRALAPIPTE